MTPHTATTLEAPWLRQGRVGYLLALLNGDGEEARVVGGAVRNTLLGLRATETDVATTALPEEVMRRVQAAGGKPVPTGIEHGTITAIIDHDPIEVTTLRRDVETFEVPLDFLMTPENHQRRSREWKGIEREYYAVPFGDRYIWGITAGIVRNLYDRIYG